MKAIIVGAGIAGLTAARELQAQGHQVLILDKARGVGGRMATRRFAGAVFDHGAQFYTARSPEFAALLAEQAPSVAVWTDGFPDAQGRIPDELRYPRYRGVLGMTDLPKALAAGLDCRLNYSVDCVKAKDSGWCVSSVEHGDLTADAVILSPPVPQSLALLKDETLPSEVAERLTKMVYTPCFALLLVLPKAPAWSSSGALRLNDSVLAFIADNQAKGLSPLPAITLHGTAAFTQAHFAAPLAEVAELMLAAAKPYLDTAPIAQTVHRWRYATPEPIESSNPSLYAAVNGLVLVGDAFAGGRVEGASRSGSAGARYLLG